MPMSWNSGSQLTITSRSATRFVAAYMDSTFAHRLRWVILTAFGVAVEPEVSWRKAVSSSPGSAGSRSASAESAASADSVEPAARSSSTVTAGNGLPASIAATSVNGSPTTTTRASINRSTVRVSAA